MTASVIAVLQLITTLTGYINGMKNASAEQRKLAIEASNLYGLLTSLRFRVEAAQATNDPWFQQIKLLGLKKGPLDQLETSLQAMIESMVPPPRKRDQAKSLLRYQSIKSETDDALKRIERLKSLINCALTEDLLTLSQAIQDRVTTLGEATAELDIRTKRLHTHAEQGLQDRLSCWLRIPDPSTNYYTALGKRHPDTGFWLLNSQFFQDGKTSTYSFMWLHGNAGCGKTVLSPALLQDILQYNDSQPNSVVGYFYFDFNDIEKQSPSKAIWSLAFQVSQQIDGLTSLKQLYQKCEAGNRQPAEDMIQSLLQDMVTRNENIHIVLDALDECKDSELLLIFLGELIGMRGLRIVATSRREKDIEDHFSTTAQHNINIESAVVDEDIYIYTRDRLATDIKLKKWPPMVQEEIISAITKNADGMYEL